MPHPNGPRMGRVTGRFRNTLINNASKSSIPAPPVSPSSAVAYGQQLAQAANTLYARLAALRAQKGLIQGQFRVDRAQARANAIANMASTVNQALDRGIVGSSIDLAARSGVLAQRSAEVQAALQARLQGLLGLRAERLAAFNEYLNQLYAIQAAKAAQQAEAANQALLQDLVQRVGDETVTPPLEFPLASSVPPPVVPAKTRKRPRIIPGRKT